MMEDYCNQKAALKKKNGTNEYAESQYDAPVTIMVREEKRTRLVRNKQGKEVISNTTFYTCSPVNADDLINDIEIIAVEEIPDIDGKIEGYEVMT